MKKAIKVILKLLTAYEMRVLRRLLVGEGCLYRHRKLYVKLHWYYYTTGKMPEKVASAETKDPAEWILERVEEDLKLVLNNPKRRRELIKEG